MQLENVFYRTDTTKQAHSAAAKCFSTKRKHKTRIWIAKPSKQERRDVQKSLLSDPVPLYSSETTETQTSKSCHVYAYVHVYIHYTQYTSTQERVVMQSTCLLYTCTCTLVCTVKILANVHNGRKLEKGNINTSVRDDIISADIYAIKPLLTESAWLLLNEEGAQLHACVLYYNHIQLSTNGNCGSATLAVPLH